MRLLATLLLCVLGARTLPAQATIEGRIIDTADTRLSGVEVEAVGLGTAVTDGNGVYRLRGLPAGTILLRARRFGYQPAMRVVTVGADVATERQDFELVKVGAVLDTVRTTVERWNSLNDPGGFDWRTRNHAAGTFVTADAIARSHAATLAEVFERLTYTRISTGPPAAPPAPVAGKDGNRSGYAAPCTHPQLFIDGLRIWEHYDFSSIPPSQVRGIEIYARGALAPPQFATAGATCGVILIWTKTT